MSMTVNELLDRLNEIVEMDDDAGDFEVRLAHQPSWPLQFTLSGVVDPGGDDCTECGEDRLYVEHDMENDDFDHEFKTQDEPVVYLVEGHHPSNDSPYASKGLWDRAY